MLSTVGWPGGTRCRAAARRNPSCTTSGTEQLAALSELVLMKWVILHKPCNVTLQWLDCKSGWWPRQHSHGTPLAAEAA
eukprot:1139335-Pelagomonas_calceolata.AAC.3